jgi:hypothetical protein
MKQQNGFIGFSGFLIMVAFLAPSFGTAILIDSAWAGLVGLVSAVAFYAVSKSKKWDSGLTYLLTGVNAIVGMGKIVYELFIK